MSPALAEVVRRAIEKRPGDRFESAWSPRRGSGRGPDRHAIVDAMLELLPVTIDEPRLARLLQLYLHEWSALVPTSIGEDGLYHYADVPLYRDTPTREVYLFLAADEPRVPVGFGLTMRDDDGRWHVEDFFVIAGARRRGLGAAAATALVATHAGPWTLTVRPENPRALAFWRAALPAATALPEPGADGIVRTRFSLVVSAS